MAANDPKKKPNPNNVNPPLADAADAFLISESGGEAFVDFGTVAPIHEGASGVIPLDELPEPPSSQSLTSWTEVIRRQRAAAEAEVAPTPIPAGTPVAVDSPSDRDLLSHLMNLDANRVSTGFSSTDPVSRHPAATTEIPEADIPMVVSADEFIKRSDPADDIRQLLEAEPPTGTPSGGSQIRFEILTPPSDAAAIIPAPNGPSSDVRLGVYGKKPKLDEEAIPFEADLSDDSSNAALGEMPKQSGPATNQSSILDVLLSESNLDFPATPKSDPGPYNPFENSQDTPFRSTKPTLPTAGSFGAAPFPTQSSFELPEMPELPTNLPMPAGLEEGTSESSYGMKILEPTMFDDSDDAVDLYGQDVPQPSLTDSGSLEISDEVIEEAARKQRLIESSAVDLSSRPSLHGSEFDIEGMPSEFNPNSNNSIDLNMPQTVEVNENSMIRPLDMDEANALDEEIKSTRQRRSAVLAAEEAARQRNQSTVTPVGEPTGSGTRGGIIGTAAGLLLGAGGVFGAWAAGILPNGKNDNSVDVSELVSVRSESDTNKKAFADYRSQVAKAFTDAKFTTPEEGLSALPTLVSEKEKATAKINELLKEAQLQTQKAATAEKAEKQAAADLKTAQESLTTATKKAEEAQTALADVTKSLKDAGIDPAKPAETLKDLVTKKTEAEKLAKEAKDAEEKAVKLAKEYETKVEVAMKQAIDANKLATDAKKAADDAKMAVELAMKGKDAADMTLKAFAEKLTKAKFAPANADVATMLKGLDDAIKAGSTDATATLRDELTKMRDLATKTKTDLDAMAIKQQDAEKMLITAQQQAKKAADDLKALTTKSADELAAMKLSNEKFSKELADLTAKNNAAQAKVVQASVELEKTTLELTKTKESLTSQIAKLKADNDALNRDLNAVKELSLAIKNASGNKTTTAKPDPVALADKFFSDGVRNFYAGRYADAEKALTKAVAINNDDARYYYLLGLSLHQVGKSQEATTAFERGGELEALGRPNGKQIDSILERIQGPLRLMVNNYRP